MSRTRELAARKIHSAADLWRRLTARERAVILCAGVEEPIAAPNNIINSLTAWGLMVARSRGHVLTRAGMQVQEHGRGEA